MNKIVIIDCGSLIFRAAVTNETDDLGVSKQYFTNRISSIINHTQSEEFILCVDSDETWKKKLVPSYKSDRSKNHKKFLEETKQWVLTLGGTMIEGLEADDLCGIFNTMIDGIICHIDSDINIVPGTHCNFDWIFNPVKEAVYEIENGNNLFYKNIICGTHNNNKGLPRFGEETFNKLIDTTISTDIEIVGKLLNWFQKGVETNEVPGIRKVKGLEKLFGVIEFYKNYIQSYVIQDKKEGEKLLKLLGMETEINYNLMKKEEIGTWIKPLF